MLGKIKNYLIHREGPVSLSELACHFDMETDTMRFMLHHWVRKGKVIQHESPCHASSECSGCSASRMRYYEWNEAFAYKKITSASL